MSLSIKGPDERPVPVSKYDLSTYLGRVSHCVEISDPRTLLTTAHQLEQSRQALIDYRHGRIQDFGEPLWQAKKLLDASVHPDTGETILLPFRMSSCVLSNLVVTAGMLTPGLGPLGTVLWQWGNQSLNVAINISNSNKSHPLNTRQLVTNYVAAVTASCGVALGLNAIVPRLRSVTPTARLVLGRLIPFAAVVTAGVVNVFLMRSQEIKKGISVFDPQSKQQVGTSQTAAIYAVGETAASRVINATPLMVIPPLVLLKLQQGFLKGKGLGITSLVNLGVIACTGFVVLPFALAIFPQVETVPVSRLEPRFHHLKLADGRPLEYLEFNRGI